jgi:hypothetical protein
MGEFTWDEVESAGKDKYGRGWIGRELTRHEQSLQRCQTSSVKVPCAVLPGHFNTHFYYGKWGTKRLRARRAEVDAKETEMIAQWVGAVEWLRASRPSEVARCKRRGGRPDTYDWEGMNLEAAALMRQTPDMERSELRGALILWFKDRYDVEMGESTSFRKKFGKLWDRMNCPE